MNCQKCGTQIQEGVTFCSSCGANQGNSVAPAPPVRNNDFSMQNFETMHEVYSVKFPEYEAKHIELNKKSKRNFIICIPLLIVLSPLVIAVQIGIPPLGLLLTLAWAGGTIVFPIAKMFQYRKELKIYGEELYKKSKNNQ